MKPRLLDLFCGAGGCAKGYQRAGFEVWGVDIHPQPRYCGDYFLQADALDVLRFLCEGADDGESLKFVERRHDQVGERVGSALVAVGGFHVQMNEDLAGHDDTPSFGVDFDSPPAGSVVKGFDAIHASPPCQGYSVANNVHKIAHPLLIADVRRLLVASGKPWVIENVQGAWREMPGAVTVCGLSLGLNVKRHRLFESSHALMVPPCGDHRGDWLLVFGHSVMERGHVVRQTPAGHNTTHRKHTTTARGREAMGIDWMNRDELSEAIPPAYTELVGAQLLGHLHYSARAQAGAPEEVALAPSPVSGPPEREAEA